MRNYIKGVFNNIYYNIISLNSFFSLCSYNEKTDQCEVYYLTDKNFTLEQEKKLAEEIRLKNTNFDGEYVTLYTGDVTFFNLIEMQSNVRLASIFGFEPDNFPGKYPLVRDVDSEYDPEEAHPYLLGYNSLNYDMTILALYFTEVFKVKDDENKAVFIPTTAQIMKRYNDELFSSFFKQNMPSRLRYVYTLDPKEQKMPTTYRIKDRYLKDEGYSTSNQAYYVRKNQLKSGRHIDVVKLNEKAGHIGKKRLLGMLGYQIWESDIDLKAKGNIQELTFDEIKSLIAYNFSTVINMKKLFHDKTYVVTFNLKKQMLLDYPEVIYEKVAGNGKENYKPDISPKKVKNNRLTINSSSASIAAACLCPYGRLSDIDAVSFLYPSKEKAEELGIPQVNILNETIKFIEERMKPFVKNKRGQEIIDTLYEVISMYKNIEGKDFNTAHENNDIYDLKKLSKNINVPYMNEYGDVSDCYVTFSVGGLHGAEYNKEAYDKDCTSYRLYKKITEKYGSALGLACEKDEYGNIKRRNVVIIDDVKYPVSEFLKPGYTENNAEFKKEYVCLKKPELFPKNSNGLRKLNKKYAKTSFGIANHEDFVSYYSSLLINLGAFTNDGLGYDRYNEIFENKEKNGKLMKDETLPEEKRLLYASMREGTKLILNAASGAADVRHDTPIRMNNIIISMRIIGQLFTWRIGQAQALEGAKVVSTNTDGLYTICDEEKNTRILKREANDIRIGIEPEEVYLVSKDANNRWEGILKEYTGNSLTDIEITNAAGGTLSCMNGPLITKSLDHPAIFDWALAEFLKWKVLQGKLDKFVDKMGLKLIKEVSPYIFNNKREFLRMFQNIISSSESIGTYNFASKIPYNPNDEDKIEPILLQKCNRIFYVNPEQVPEEYKNQIVYLATAYIRQEQSDANLLAVYVIKDMNHNTEAILTGTPKIKKINGIEFDTPCMIMNEELACTQFEPSWLDFNYYNKVLCEKYTENWKNIECKEN